MTTRDAAQPLSRADKLRMQRAHQERARDQAAEKAAPVRLHVDTPPIVQRGNTRTPINPRLQQTQVKRKYSLPMGKTGGELVIPALPQLKIGWRIVSGLIFATMVFMLFTFSASSSYRVKQAAISGNQRISATDMNLILGAIGKPLFMLNAHQLKNKLAAAYPELSSIEISVTLPDQLNISVSEREPVVAWQMEGQTLWIDQEGVVFQTRGEITPQVLIRSQVIPPVQATQLEQVASGARFLPSQLIQQNGLSSSVNIHKLDADLLEAALVLSKKLPAGTELIYTAEHGLGWQTEQGWYTFVGFNLKDIDEKMAVYEQIVQSLTSQAITPGFISIEYLHAPYYRMERKQW